MNIPDKVAEVAHKAVDGNTTDKVSEFAHDTVDTMAKASHKAGEAVADVTKQAKETFDEKSEQLINAEQRLVKNCQAYVHANPLTSLGIAVAGGFLLSRLLLSDHE